MQLTVSGKFSEATLDPTIWSLGDTTHHKPPPKYRAVDHKPLAATIQTLYSVKILAFRSFLFRDKNVLWDHIKDLAQDKVDDISCSSLVHWKLVHTSSQKVTRLIRHNQPFWKMCWLVCLIIVSRRIYFMIFLAAEVRLPGL